MKHSRDEREDKGKSFLLYRKEILRLLAADKSPHDALIVELPCLMGFRNEETTTWREEYIDFKREDTFVFDAKRHEWCPVPLNRVCARHAEQSLNVRTEGLVIENQSSAWRGREEPITTTAVWYTWRKLAERLKLFPSPEAYSPIVGRRFFIKEYLTANREDPVEAAITCSRIVRHSKVAITLEYASNITYYEDVKRNFDTFQQHMAEVAHVPIKEVKTKDATLEAWNDTA
jgi:hypothetical protein